MKKVVMTEIGSVQWFNLVKGDKFQSYTCNLTLEGTPAAQELADTIVNMGGKVIKNADGSISLKLKQKMQGQKKDGSTYDIPAPIIYKRDGSVYSIEELASLTVGNGSRCRFKIELSEWAFMGNTGCSIKPKACQIDTIEGFGGNDFEALSPEESGDDFGGM